MPDTGGESLLTDLCAICHANPIKYTCPRCGIHTCSLPCVKRHKTWAQCSGIRNPAAYRKRADLATPGSVDQDFNFITSVERSLQKADDMPLNREKALAPSGLRHQQHGSKKGRLDTEVEERGIRLVRAPHGLSRNRQNKSRWGSQKENCIMWTTEWIHHDGTTRMQNILESRTVREAFVHCFGKNALLGKRKRKRSDLETANVRATEDDTLAVQATQEEAIQDPPPTENNVALEDPIPDDAAPLHEELQVPNTSEEAATKTQASDATDPLHSLHFYLLRPMTTAKLKCLIPISQTSTLKDVLQGRTILEFPTFYVRQELPEALPEPFITEEKYDNHYGKEIPIDLPAYVPNDTATNEPPTSLADIDEQKVLEVLQKDLTG
ncbi:hypothetical protein LTR10_023697 [Elasticomyces elasticus]|uniref:HIT-type domain-containing protein n=1 Tax=Exophiala sideris TaxID=1016849 RepID=A0ABR0JPA3_9EURO|nr:hypothetical protein LTR10_023697 [Elasticomyces elasticus]KAK5038334.1 hypothetical protein LTS07_001804 [Exophiala sideris]KAK5044318.1 hypothetical protein LTR13_000674 [Exophiala sideris]KAK5067818.1 hypothetical protein LTR69_001807 [Exophiala sideris]KAK5183940.1 hypothetical protein LTR44_003445 [Eurotiomycetes sp. CCFEE 6388]